ncbi:MAG TPA: DUF523 domain-containing protein [Methanomicrobia archaeon]|nr:DUF523 domain-containing protein [Methanomicrobia archaeon]HHF09761.1 DUF523 domain-containing protein [Methanomicrobia archaeon]
MKRSRKIIFVSHCLINTNSKALTSAKHKAYYEGIVEKILKNDVGIIQAPCPELLYGVNRPPMNKEFYDTEEYREYCRDIIEYLLEIYKLYSKNRYQILGFVGIEGSPTCGVSKTHITVNGEPKKVKGKGVFIEELEKKCKEEGIELKIRDQDDIDELLR